MTTETGRRHDRRVACAWCGRPIVDDSSLVRSIFSRVIESDPGLELAGTAYSAEDALHHEGADGHR